ncbi:MAG: hypothetical protein ACRDL7_05020 [Gaiellaceae bacterium]
MNIFPAVVPFNIVMLAVFIVSTMPVTKRAMLAPHNSDNEDSDSDKDVDDGKDEGDGDEDFVDIPKASVGGTVSVNNM